MASGNTSPSGTSVAPGSQLARLLAAAERAYPLQPDDTARPPWVEDQNIEIKTVGGLYNRERRRVMVAADTYKRVVGGHRDAVVTGDHATTVGKAALVRIGPQPDDDSEGEGQEEAPPRPTLSAPGRDSLVVDGNASLSGHDRRVSMGGIYHRTWGGGVIRMAGLEGVICGGGFVRLIAGPSLHFAQIVSGDVYGGGLHAAATRVHAAGFGYRSAELAAWACGLYVRATRTTITPVIGSQSRTFSKRSLAAKMARIALGLCPPLDIMVGIGGLILAFTLAPIFNAIQKKRGIKRKPPKTNPRSLVRNIGFRNQTTGKELNT